MAATTLLIGLMSPSAFVLPQLVEGDEVFVDSSAAGLDVEVTEDAVLA